MNNLSKIWLEILESVFDTSGNTMLSILSEWPKIVAAIGILLIGWLLMYLIRLIIIKTAKKLALHTISSKSGLTDFLKKAQVKSPPSNVIANFIGGYVFTIFFLKATSTVGLTAISDFLDTVIHYIPNVIVALFIVLFGIQIANMTSSLVESTSKILGDQTAYILKLVSRNIIIIFSVLTALFQLNIADELVKIVFIGLIALIAIAGGLACGLGSVDLVKENLKNLKK